MYLQYKTVLTPPADYLALMAAAKESNITDGNVTSTGKPSTNQSFYEMSERDIMWVLYL